VIKSVLNDMDLSLLTEKEAKALTSILQKRPLSMKLGFVCALTVIYAVATTLFTDGNPGYPALFTAGIKAAVFIGLSFWARNWSLIPSILLLAWHLFANAPFIMSHSVESKIIYIIFSLLFLWSLLGCNVRMQLIRKTQC